MTRRRIGWRSFVFPQHHWWNHLTLGGKTLVLALLFCFHGIVSLESPLIYMFASVLALLLVTCAVSLIFRPRIAIRIHAPSSVACNEPFQLAVVLSDARSTAFDLVVELVDKPDSWEVVGPSTMVKSLAPGEEVTLLVTVRPKQRGVFPLPLARAVSTFPFNLFRFYRKGERGGELIVVPAYHPLSGLELPQQAAHAQAGEFTGNIRTGDSKDYFGSRDYQPGVPVRRWDYSSWARLGRPVVREYHEVQQTSATVVVDTFYPRRSPASETTIPEMECSVSLAAALCEALTAQGCRIETLLTGSQVVRHAGDLLLMQQEMILEVLARAVPCAPQSWDNLFGAISEMPAHAGVVFVLLNRWDARRESLCDLLETPGRDVRKLLVCDGATGCVDAPDDVQLISMSAIRDGEVSIP